MGSYLKAGNSMLCYVAPNSTVVKNFSILTTKDGRRMLSPAYDLLNTSIVQKNTVEELALPLNGKKANLKRSDVVDYYGRERLGLTYQTIDRVQADFKKIVPLWDELIGHSFLNDLMKQKCRLLLAQRRAVLEM